MILGNSILVYLKTAENCQLKCSHCFFSSGSAPKSLLNIDNSISWFKKLEIFAPWLKDIQINYFGGEPMLTPIEDLIRFKEKTKDFWNNQIRYTITSNLTYSLTKEKLDFLLSLDGISTSWDYKIRFETEAQFNLWKKNCIKLIKEHNKDLTLQISLTKETISYDIRKIFDMCKEIGFKDVQFEKLSLTGDAILNPQIFPTNKDLDKWFLEMYQIYTENQYFKYFSNSYINSILTSYLYNTYSGCRSRNCMTKIFTINANETIATCPNYAMIKDQQIGNLNDEILKILSSRTRQKSISCETSVDKRCLECPVYNICNAGCMASTSFDADNICSEAKSLMIKLKNEKNYTLYKQILGEFKGSEIV